MTPEYWPSNLVPASILFRIKPMSGFGPMTFSGRRQAVAADAGYWVAELSGFPVLDNDAILEWRGTIAALDGAVGDLIIGPYDQLRAPVHSGLSPVITGITHSDGSLFSDGSGYSQSSIRVTLANDVDLRATTATLSIEEAGPIRKGMYFSIWSVVSGVYAPRLYMITHAPEILDNKAEIRFRPPLRVEAAAGTDVDFADPRLLMNLSSPDVGALDLAYGRFARPSISLEESWNGLS